MSAEDHAENAPLQSFEILEADSRGESSFERETIFERDPQYAESLRGRRYLFKIADSSDELSQVKRLLYQTFVLEIPRYQDPGTGYLVDKFHHRNVYFVALRDRNLCGTVAVQDGPTYSVAGAVAQPNVIQELRRPLLEARIFAVDPRHRFGIVFAGLAYSVYRYAQSKGYAHLIITGVANRQGMYERMGYRPLGPAVLRGGEYFVPMALDLDGVPKQVQSDLERWAKRRLKANLS